ncbi:50S ribosomal protein L17 [SAR202 cluster bacterium AC-409-J13_OGT_754m]|nr:50S ribosomal protein L17 [SAR202 cluster bacterium AC-409-J13_OGT_754m]
MWQRLKERSEQIVRHRVAGRKLGRPTGERVALLRSLVTSLIIHEKLVTTVTRAKEARILCEKMITFGKKGTLHHRRLALSEISNSRVVGKVFDVLGPRYLERAGGYTRVIRLASRKGDAAPLAQLELV